jgi:hypothetical protein
MAREFVRLLEFEKQCKRVGLTEDDVRALENILLPTPDIGDIIEGTGGLRKFRYALPNRGKSGGARIIYIDFLSYEKIYFVTTYSKSETDNLSRAEKNELKKLVKVLEAELRGAK